jgi:hypothetical protein
VPTAVEAIEHTINKNLFQSSNESCWYAAYCMLFEWKGTPTSQIRERMDKAPKLDGLDYLDFWKRGLPDDKYNATRWSLGLSGFRRAYFATMLDDIGFLSKSLRDYGPFWVAWSVPSEHAVILHGVDNSGQLKVMNPTGNGYGTATPMTMTVTEFKRRLGAKDVPSAAQMFP